MHPRMIAAREAVAVQGMTVSLIGLAALLGQPDPGLDLEKIEHRDPALQQLFRLEALAALLTRWAELEPTTEPAEPEGD